MNVTRKDIDRLNAMLTIEVVKVDYEEKVEKSLRNYRKKANIPGFRPGMVPMGMIRKMYGKAVLGEEVNQLLSEALYNYVKENNLHILGEPLSNETEQKPVNFDTDENFEFVFDIALAPELDTNLTKKDKVAYYEIEVDDKMLNERIDLLARRFGQYVQAEEVEENDVLKGILTELENGEPKAGGIKVEGATLSPMHIKDEAQKKLFIGAKKGELRFNPHVAYAGSEVELASLLKIKKEEVAAATADFAFQIENITRYVPAEVNKELFDKVYGEGKVADEAAFRAKVQEEIKRDLEQETAYRFGIDAKAMLMKKNEGVAFPDAFLKRWVLATNEKMTEETLEKDYPAMVEELKWQLLKDKLAADNGIKVERADLEAYAKYVAQMQFAQYGLTGVDDALLDNYVKDMMKREDQVRGMAERVVENKVFDHIKAQVKLDNKTLSMEKFQDLYK